MKNAWRALGLMVTLLGGMQPGWAEDLDATADAYLQAIEAQDWQRMASFLTGSSIYQDFTMEHFDRPPIDLVGADEIVRFYEQSSNSVDTQEIRFTVEKRFTAGPNTVLDMVVRVTSSGAAWDLPLEKVVVDMPVVTFLRIVDGKVTHHVDHADYAEGERQIEALRAEPDAADTAVPGPWGGEVLAALVGTWDGTGTVYGNPVTLERDWSFDLADRFLRGDMKVRMANGGQFRALTFWRRTGDVRYQATWIDESGKSQVLDGTADPASQEVTVHYLDEGYGEGPAEWRRLVFRVTGAHSYLELLYTADGDGWKPIGTFRFSRRPAE